MRKLGPLNVSVVCLGTMTWGNQNTEAEAHEQLDVFVDCGGNFVDTAELYPVPPGANNATCPSKLPRARQGSALCSASPQVAAQWWLTPGVCPQARSLQGARRSSSEAGVQSTRTTARSWFWPRKLPDLCR